MSNCDKPPRKGPRASSLPIALRCPAFPITKRVMGDSAGPAAHSGSAVGKVIELWHRYGEDGPAFEEALQVAQSPQEVAAGDYARARWDDVKHWALMYAQDPRNKGCVVAEYCELEVTYTFAADADDPDQTPICITGHVDEIRRDEFGHLRVWDTKSGRAAGSDMIHDYAAQLAVYALGCTETLGETVLPGGIIRLRGYDTKRGKPAPDEFKVFFETPWTLEQCESLVRGSAYVIGEWGRGIVRVAPGDQCRYCPGGGWPNCERVIDEWLAGEAAS